MKKFTLICFVFIVMINNVLAYSSLEYFLEDNSESILPILLFFISFVVIFKALEKSFFKEDKKSNLLVSGAISLLAVWGILREYNNFVYDYYLMIIQGGISLFLIIVFIGLSIAFVRFLIGRPPRRR